jgi:uroporphyrinogen-III synthase
MSSSINLDDSHVEVLHQTVTQIAAADGFHQALDRVLDFAVELVKCDSCFIYVLAGEDLVLSASQNPHQEILDRLKLRVGQGITGWVAEHREPVSISREAFKDPRFRRFNELPEDRYEAFLSVPLFARGRLVGVMNLQHREPHVYSPRDIRLLCTVGSLAGAEIEMARLDIENSDLSQRLETRKLVERAKGILQRDLGLTEEKAYLSIQRQSRQKRKTMKEIAEAIVLSEEVRSSSRTES